MERMYFFDSTSDDQRIYQAADFARFHAQIIGNGVSNTANLPDLEVTAKTNMDVALGAGYMFANGYMYENDSTMTLKHVIADPVNDRIDRVVIRFDNNPSERRIYAYIKQGVPAKSPTPPSLQRDEYIYEMSVAQVRIKAGKSFIEQSQITDERANDAVCGYIPLHNIYRGLRINQNGLVTMPNQSFVKGTNKNPIVFKTEDTIMPFGTVEIDKQNEVASDNKRFIPKDAGIYHFWFEIAWHDNVLPENVGFRTYLYKNGRESFPLGAMYAPSSRDRYFIGSGSDVVEKGEELTFVVRIAHLGNKTMPGTWFTRIRIAKIA
ncbi:MAG: Structural protein [Virgibacillus proomii]